MMTLDQILDRWEHDPYICAEVLGANGYQRESETITRMLRKEQPINFARPLTTWIFERHIKARHNIEWFIKTDLNEEWRARRWTRDPKANINLSWIEGNLTRFVEKRQAIGFKRDQYDYVVAEAIRQYDMDPVEFWPKGHYHQSHDIVGAANDNTIIISSRNSVWVCPIDENNEWNINSKTPCLKINGQMSIKVTEWLGL